MGQIRITPDQMREHSRTVENKQTEFGELFSSMSALLDTLETEWEGQASASYRRQFEDLRPSFQSMQDLLGNLSSQLNETAKALENLDQEISNKFSVV